MKQRCKSAKNWFDFRKVVASYLDLMDRFSSYCSGLAMTRASTSE
jgi:hypothetical protein